MGAIRILLAIGVMFGHAGVPQLDMAGGLTGVQAFFVISGFYMTLILRTKYTSLWLFYSNRALRLYPVYWAVLALSVGYWGVGTYVQYVLTLPALAAAYVFGSTLSLLGIEWSHFLVATPEGLRWSAHAWNAVPPLYTYQPVLAAWSLGVEISFYIVAPWLVRRSLWVLVAVIAASVGLRLLGQAVGVEEGPWYNRFFPFELAFFVTGVLSCRAYLHFEPAIRQWPRAMLWTAFLALVLAVATFTKLPDIHVWKVSLTSLVFILGLAACMPLVFTLTRNCPLDTAIGELSYPLYLSHLLVLWVLHDKLPADPLPKAIFVAVTCFSLAIALEQVVERPIRWWREGRVRAAAQTG